MEWLVWILTDPGVHRSCDYRFVIISRIHGLSLLLAGKVPISRGKPESLKHDHGLPGSARLHGRVKSTPHSNSCQNRRFNRLSAWWTGLRIRIELKNPIPPQSLWQKHKCTGRGRE